MIELFHGAALGSPVPGRALGISVGATIVLLLVGAAGHRRHDRLFVDLL